MKKKLLLIASLILIALLFYYFLPSNSVVVMDAEYAFDLSDTEQLVGWADNVFVGKIQRIVNTVNDDISPVTTYEVSVVENLKGELSGTVLVSHRIGYSHLQRATFKFKNDNYMKTSESYIIICRYDKEKGTYMVVPTYGDIKLEENTRKEQILDYKENIKNQKKVLY